MRTGNAARWFCMLLLVAAPAAVAASCGATIAEADASAGIAWAMALTEAGVAEEYALGAMTLEDAYIRLTSHMSSDGPDEDA